MFSQTGTDVQYYPGGMKARLSDDINILSVMILTKITLAHVSRSQIRPIHHTLKWTEVCSIDHKLIDYQYESAEFLTKQIDVSHISQMLSNTQKCNISNPVTFTCED